MSSPWDDAVTTEVEFCPRTADGFATLAVNGKEVIRQKLAADDVMVPFIFIQHADVGLDVRVFEFKEKA